MQHNTDGMWVNIGGRLMEPAAASVPVLDRGFLYGDSLYEVARTYGGALFLLDEHLERMEGSARLARMVLSQRREEYAQEMIRTVEAVRKSPGRGNSDVYCRIIVTRGTGKIGFSLKNVETPTQYAIIAEPIDRFLPPDFEKGSSLRIVERFRNDRRALDPAMKSGNYLNSLLAYLEAVASGDADDAILCNAQGFVTEGTTFNVGYVRRGILATPPLDSGILEGLTRRHLLRIARELGIETREVDFPKERLHEADEVFTASTLKEIYPVTRLDGRPVGNGKAGPVTRRLAKAFSAWARASVGRAAGAA
ncbi:MAG: aminotransferase class IV [Bdellovibrionales bacterium]|nr:aminotransferase class IV [Bdellovibrionales bacterium]